ncbi:LacI family transcriptional regulator [Alicyclobacillus tolerans]|uniref:LacI family DNA-binding transcriptional regulator n=1 Tax=Alicyclobacillus tolerans TaxID=90970 RepID=UPI001F46D2B4|nr:LacI family DNA-binding transcriptional regulator [Alicyclobacillus tolerans]MCF8567332.1 LacI family transcriptional regulator [Alicyclobacillus tolerans]
MATIKDVAKLAGVAVSTASDALNNKLGVKSATRSKVLKAARKLNYVPNELARGLISNSTKTIGIVLSGPESFDIFTNPSFFEMVQSIIVVLSKLGYRTQLNVIPTRDVEQIVRIAHSRTVDGMLLLGTRGNDFEISKLLKQIPIPYLLVGRRISSEDVCYVSVDDSVCSSIATEFLIKMGHTRIGYIGELPGDNLAEQRLKGYRDTLNKFGLPYDDTIVLPGDFYQESGASAIRQLLLNKSAYPTAIFVANDLMALGVLEGLQREGLRVPDDISIIGCDNIPNLHLLYIPLTTVSIPFYEIGSIAAEKIVNMINSNSNEPTQILLQCSLRIRNSVKQIV